MIRRPVVTALLVVAGGLAVVVALFALGGGPASRADGASEGAPAGFADAGEGRPSSEDGASQRVEGAPSVTCTGTGASSAERVQAKVDLRRLQPSVSKGAIRSIYSPTFLSASGALLNDGDHVLGLELNGKARAYPVSLLNLREMVNDVVGGVPVLASW